MQLFKKPKLLQQNSDPKHLRIYQELLQEMQAKAFDLQGKVSEHLLSKTRKTPS